MSPGGYVDQIVINSQTTTASKLFVHGGGASISWADGPILNVSVAATLRHLHFEGGAGIDLGTVGQVLDDVSISNAASGVDTDAALTMHNVHINDVGYGIVLRAGAQLVLDGAVISGGMKAIEATDFGNSVDIKNLLVYGTSGVAIDLAKSSGTVAFSTIADSGANTGTGPRAFACSAQVTVRSSIVWAPGAAARAPIEGCNLVATIAGPTAVPGATNTDPRFVSPTNHDYHLQPNSPARDMVDTGPMTDFEGDPRPLGARFDIGADEAPAP